jgi:hypothetical protein
LLHVSNRWRAVLRVLTAAFRPVPEPDTGKRIDAGNISVTSGDPEDGGEVRSE